MPKMLSYGTTGADVGTLQSTLNQRPPTALPPLAVDQVFGPKTLARVKEFQGHHQLAVDGIVGPKTWEVLLAKQPQKTFPERTGIDCATSDPDNQAFVLSVKGQFLASRPTASRGPVFARRAAGFKAASFVPAGAKAFQADDSSSSPFRFLTEPQQNTAKKAFGNSLDFSRIFISNKTGLGNRPFTVAFPDQNEVVQIMNCGTFSPSEALLIHELTHVWQSQHHSDPFRFMVNAVDCQAGAVVANGAEVFNDPDILLHKDHPVQFPFSAYAYMPGLGLVDYPAEQMANSVEHGDTAIRAHVSKAAMNAVDPDNITALKKVAFGDRRQSGIVF